MNPVVRIGVVAVALLLITVAAAADAARKPKDLLQYIPADTPYVMAFTKPLPDALLDKMEPAVEETLKITQDEITTSPSQGITRPWTSTRSQSTSREARM